ncbi:MAG TPA: class I SAM-dependent methyltransferase, partial [Thermoanaerobaculia bacterium]
MTTNDRIAKEFWDREVVEQTHVTWMGDPLVRAYINESISGSSDRWPLDWFQTFTQRRTFSRGLSIGCGSGGLERDLLSRGVCEELDAFDGSAESIRIATEEAARAGFAERVHYSVGDFNEPRLPRATYDIVFVHQAMHHVAKLEKLYRAILRTLKPGGLL